MRIAITGISSNLAKILLQHFSRENWDVDIIGIDIVPPEIEDLPVQFHNINILNKSQLLPALDGVDVVIHLAFIVSAINQPVSQLVNTCVEGSKNVFEAALARGVKKIIYTSSIAAYGYHPGTFTGYLKENEPLRGEEQRWFYAKAKALVEKALVDISSRAPGTVFTVLRPSFILGPVAFMDNVKMFVGPIVNGKPYIFLKPRCFPKAMGQFTHEDDVCQFIIKSIKEDLPGCFNIATDVEELEPIYHKRGGTIKYIPWGLFHFIHWFVKRLNLKIRHDMDCFLLFKNPPLMDVSKIETTGFKRQFPNTGSIYDQCIEHMKQGNT
ncbi:MAG: NAD-dependent epimerase/dehydratase family protein [Candidatus Hodarchaeota archaeon]